ncbi:MAG: threonyl-tRNA synthetase editing domain-containing protein [Candidatus Hermodarchaeota archaeon]|nr:threonyl-tRNA synthetase editing domain-containing protein [Candidatus Hermodarchaeota archaeon]
MMRLLIFHGNLAYKATEPVKINVREDAEEGKWLSFENVLTAFCAIEASDEGRLTEIASKAADELHTVAERVKVKDIVLYPHAHIFPRKLGRPKFAVQLLQALSDELHKRGYKVTRAPFGWYKAFKLECIGHPLSESGRTID